MADPKKPVIDYSYVGFQQEAQDFPFPGTQLDNDLAKLVVSVDETIDALKDIRRADGQLKNRIVTADSLSDELTLGIRKPVEWEPGVRYTAGATVFIDNVIYRASETHESATTFAEDLAAGMWQVIVNFKEVAEETLENAQAAEASKMAAAGSASAAAGSASASAGYAALAQEWAAGTEPAGPGTLSAREEAERAEIAAAQAADKVSFVEQELTVEQQQQARANIRVASVYGSLRAETRAILGHAEALGGQEPTRLRALLMDEVVGRLLDNDVWNYLDFAHFHAAHDRVFSLIDWRHPGRWDLEAVGDDGYLTDTGWRGNGSSGNNVSLPVGPASDRYNTARGDILYSLNNAHMSVAVADGSGSSNNYLIGHAGASLAYILVGTSDLVTRGNVSGVGSAPHGKPTTSGCYAWTRPNSAGYEQWLDGARLTTFAADAAGVSTNTLRYLRLTASLAANGTVSCGSAGAHLDAARMEPLQDAQRFWLTELGHLLLAGSTDSEDV